MRGRKLTGPFGSNLVGGSLYGGLCLALIISNALQGRAEWRPLRKMFATLADWLLYPFPNSLFPLAFGITSSWLWALVFVGFANLLFFSLVGNFLVKRNSKRAVLYSPLAYLLFSFGAYVAANYVFFSVYFMRSSHGV